MRYPIFLILLTVVLHIACRQRPDTESKAAVGAVDTTLFNYPPLPPDQAYVEDNTKKTLHGWGDFSSEAGEDTYYSLYAEFLQKKDTGKVLAGCRDTLVGIFQAVNEIFAWLNYGGTYYGHQRARIAGYAEYSVNRLSANGRNYIKEYSIQGQKEKFIAGLRQQIEDEIRVDYETLDKNEKEKRRQQVLSFLDRVNSLITNYFYLTETRAFLYSHYDV